jgi:hypothetical protein
LDALEQFFFSMGQADRAPRVDQGPGDRLLDPPRGVRGETDISRSVELLRGLDETDIALLDEIEKRHVGCHERAGYFNDQSEI